jgi:hypothetical protein
MHKPMHDLNKTGGIAALFLAASYVFGFGLFFGAIDWTGYDGPAGNVAFITDHQSLLTLAMLVLYPLAGCALVALSISMHRRAAPSIEGLMQIATAFGLIWAGVVIASGMISLIGMNTIIPLAAEHPDTAASAWVAISVVQDALGGGSEFLGGVWMAMVSWLAMRSAQMPKPLAWLGIALGLVGIASLIPSLGDLVDIFGLGQIFWFIWLGVVLLRATPAPNLVDS